MNVRNYFLNLFDLSLNEDFFHIFLNLFDLSDVFDNWDDLLSDLRLRNDSFNNLFFRNYFLYNSFNRNWYFKRHNYLPIDRYSSDALVNQRNNFFNLYLNRSFFNDCDRHLSHDLFCDNSFLICRNLYRLLNNSVYGFFNFDINVFDYFSLFDNFLNDWNLNDFLNFYNSFTNYLLFDNLFDELRNLNNLFDDSRHDNNFLNNFLNFNNSRDLHHFFNNFFNLNRHFFYSVYDCRYLNYFFFNIFYGFRHLNINIDELFYFYNNRFFYNEWNMNYNLFDMDGLNS